MRTNDEKRHSVFHPYMLGVKYPSQMYMEGHMGDYINTTLFTIKMSIFSSSDTVITYIMNGGVGRMQFYAIRKGQARVTATLPNADE